MQMNNVLVAALQETKLSQLCSLTAPEYNIVSKDRMSNRGGGFAFLIHNSIQYSVEHLPAHTAHDNVMESQAVNIVSGLTNALLLNIYIPPTTSSPSSYHPLWHCTLEESQRGTNLANQMGY